MKKFLALFAVLVLCISLFAACKPASTPNPDPKPGTIGDEEATLADAAAYLFSLYKDGAEATERDYDVVGKVMIGTTVFEVTWSVDVDTIKIVKSKKEGFWTVDLPSKAEAEIPYTLTATIKDAAGNTETKTFKRKVPVMDNSLLVTEPQEGVAYKFFMKQTSIGLTLFANGEMDGEKYLASVTDAKSTPDFFAEKVDGGVKVYTEKDGKKLYIYAYTVKGDDGKVSKYLTYSETDSTVWSYDEEVNAWYTNIGGTDYVMGTYSTYKTFCISEKSYITAANSGVSQFPAHFADKAAAEALDPAAGITIYQTPEEIVKAVYALEKGKVLSAGHQYTLTGVITKVNSAYDAGYGNITVTIVVNGMTNYPIECFRMKGDGADKIKKGDTITVKGELLKYDNGSEEGKVEFNSGCVLVSYKATGAAEQKFENAEIKPVKPVVGNPYKIVFVQENKNSTAYFLTGLMDGYYAEGVTVEADAADFYIENTTGGYYVYAMVGGKKLYAYVSTSTSTADDGSIRNHVNINFDASKKTVCTYSESLKTMVTTVNGEEYAIFATDASKSYTTLSPRKTSGSNFYGHFVVQGTTTGTTPEEKPSVKPEATEDFKEGVAYKIFLVAGNGNAYYAIGEADNDKFIKTTENVKQAVDFYFEKSGSGYKIYFKNGTKKMYLDATTTTEGEKTSKFLSFKESTNAVFTYDKALGTWFTTVGGKKWGIGTYGSYTTISMSDASYFTADAVGKTQFVMQFVESSKAPTGDEGGDDEGDDTPTTQDPAADSTLTIEQAIALGASKEHNTYTSGKYYVVGEITEVYNTQYGNMKIKDANGNILTVYGTYDADGTNRYDAMTTKPVAGDTVKVYGIIGQYNDTPQMKNGWIVEHIPAGTTPPAGGDDEGDDTTDTAPVQENVAYNMFLNQVTLGSELYATHTISTKYIATTTSVGEAAVFYAEKVDGGWKFYTTIDGAKMYLHSWLEGNSKYIGYAATSDVVYSYDAEVNAWWTTINGTEYAVGTYSNFNTICISAKSYINAENTGVSQFPVVFVNAPAGGDVNPPAGGGDEGEDDDTPTYTTPAEILQAAYALDLGGTLGEYTLTGVITSVDSAFSTQHSNVTVTIVVDGLTDYPIQCYRMKGTGADVIKVGDTITVTGTIIKYDDTQYGGNGKVEFNTGCSLDSYVVGTTPDEGGDDEGGDDVQGGTTEGATASMNVYGSEGVLDAASNTDATTITWTGEGFTFVNAKGTSTTAIRVQDTDHFRVYKYNVTTIASTNGQKISQIVITCKSNADATQLAGNTFSAGTVSADGSVVTITFAEGVDSLEITANSSKWFLTSVSVTFAGAGNGGSNDNGGTTPPPAGGDDEEEDDDVQGGTVTEGATVEQAIIANQGDFNSSAKKITWTADGFTFVNEQYNSTSAIVNTQTNHFRVYASSKVTITATNGKQITKIVVTCESDSYASALAACKFTAGTAVASGSTVTITFDTPVDSVVITDGKQWRLNKVAVTFTA